MLQDVKMEPLVEPLLLWFGENARTLPWRSAPTPYRVWVSEIMLQQTRVEAVKPYFERFMKALPDVEALAVCPEDMLMKLWEGLGYYNRARNMQKAAVQVMEEYGGKLPADYGELLKLKGIGPYTAGAVASIAYGLPAAAVDGNVLRIITRVTADDTDIMKPSFRGEVEKRLLDVMQGLSLPKDLRKSLKGENVPGTLNQALMELGATVCLPNGAPLCGECPWREVCLARRQDRIGELPVKRRAKERRIEERTVFIIRDGGKVAIRKRPDTGLLAGLYELPNVEGSLGSEETLAYVKELSFLPIRLKELGEAKHIFSHVEWHMKGYAILVQEEDFAGPEADDAGKRGDMPKEAGSAGPEADDAGKRGDVPEEAGSLIFVDAKDAGERYAIPKAFAAYARHMNIRLGNERFSTGKEEI